jgi:hypothetical protein
VRTQSAQTAAPAEPAAPGFWSNPLALALAGFMLLAAYLAVMAH